MALYIDGLFVKVRCNNKHQNECFYIVLEVKEDGTREVVAIVNNFVEHPMHGAPSTWLYGKSKTRR